MLVLILSLATNDGCGESRVRTETDAWVLPTAHLSAARLPVTESAPAYRWVRPPSVRVEGRCGCCERDPEPTVEDWEFYHWPP
jgi:hypothetical protein